MTIQTISFGGKQRYDYHKPHYKHDSKMTQPTLVAAISRYNEQEQFNSMVSQAQQAQKTVPTIKNASQYALNKASDAVYDSIQIQNNSQKILSEIIDSHAFSRYCKDARSKKLFGSYITTIKSGEDVYKVTITPDKITAVQKVNGDSYITTNQIGDFCCGPINRFGKTIYEFDTKERELTYCAQGVKKQGYVTSIDSEYFFEDGYLSKFNSGVSKGNFDLINQSYSFEINRFDEHVLKSFSSKIVKTLDKENTERLFEFSPYRELVRFSRNVSKDTTKTTRKELEYSFEDGALKTYRKDFTSSPNYWGSKLFAQFTDENNFYVETHSNSSKTPEYDAICFYQDGKIEGSVL